MEMSKEERRAYLGIMRQRFDGRELRLDADDDG